MQLHFTSCRRRIGLVSRAREAMSWCCTRDLSVFSPPECIFVKKLKQELGLSGRRPSIERDLPGQPPAGHGPRRRRCATGPAQTALDMPLPSVLRLCCRAAAPQNLHAKRIQHRAWTWSTLGLVESPSQQQTAGNTAGATLQGGFWLPEGKRVWLFRSGARP